MCAQRTVYFKMDTYISSFPTFIFVIDIYIYIIVNKENLKLTV